MLTFAPQPPKGESLGITYKIVLLLKDYFNNNQNVLRSFYLNGLPLRGLGGKRQKNTFNFYYFLKLIDLNYEKTNAPIC